MFTPLDPEPIFYRLVIGGLHYYYGDYNQIVKKLQKNNINPDIMVYDTQGPFNYSTMGAFKNYFTGNHGNAFISIGIPVEMKNLTEAIKTGNCGRPVVDCLMKKFGITGQTKVRIFKKKEHLLHNPWTLIAYILSLDEFKRDIYLTQFKR
jgi:hypothetical protein